MTSAVDFLESVELTADLPAATLAAVAEAVEHRTLSAGDLLFREGDRGSFMFIVVQGQLEVRKEGEGGQEVILRLMGPREVGGLTSMAVAKRRSATLRARSAVSLLAIERGRFLGLLEAHPQLVRAVMAFLSSKVRGKTYQLATLLASRPPDVRARVAFFDAKPYDRRVFEEQPGDDLVFDFYEANLGPDTARLAAGAAAVCAFVNDDLSAPVLEQLASMGVELVAMRCAGYNNVDLRAAVDHQISVVRVPAYSPHAVAEHAVALILTLNRKTHRAYNRVREGNFSLNGLVGFDLHGRTAGIVGLGKIGRCLAEALLGFGMKVIAFDARPDPPYAAERGLRYVALDELVRAADIISLHAPLLPSTHHLINRARIADMKRGVMLINTSRGGLVDAAALIEGLKSGQIGAAGLDVYEEESEYFFEDRSDRFISDDLLARLMTFPNVLITGHQAFLTDVALDNIAATTVENLREYLAGKRGSSLTHAVLPPGDAPAA